jgi:hypothetical protein
MSNTLLGYNFHAGWYWRVFFFKVEQYKNATQLKTYLAYLDKQYSLANRIGQQMKMRDRDGGLDCCVWFVSTWLVFGCG